MARLKVTLRQRYLNVDMVNTFDYFRDDYPFGQAQAEELVDSFIVNVLEKMNAVQSVAVGNLSISAVRTDSPNVAVNRSLQGGGLVFSAATGFEPPFLAAGLRLNVGATFDSETIAPPVSGYVIKRGYKFIGGLVEDQVNNGIFDNGYLTLAWTALRNGLASDIAGDTAPADVFMPVVVSSKIGTVFPGGFSQFLAPVVSAGVPQITSLRSRKR